MADVIGLSDVSTPDTGKGSQLKTGGRRKHTMPDKKKKKTKCSLGTVYDAKLKKCVSNRKKGETLLEWQNRNMQASMKKKKPIT